MSGADANAKNALTETPLFNAVRFGHLAVVGVLLEYGADTKVRLGIFSLLQAARGMRHDDIVALLEEKEAEQS